MRYDHQERGAFEVEMDNGGRFNVIALKDEQGLIDKYKANILAPVCEDRVCYDVNLIFNWNLIGEFVDFEVFSKEPLTKLDHIPFSPEDYQRLQGILKNQDLNFVKIPAEELVVKSDKPKLDGYSGATKETVKKEVIEGALYTCYTLWHIANGAVVDSIKSHTVNALNADLVSKIAKQKSQTANYFLINHLDTNGFKENIATILNSITESKGYFSKNAIERIPEDLFGLSLVQDFIIINYSDFDYYTQKAILSKLENVSNLPPTLSQFFIDQLSTESSFSNQKIISLVLKNIDKSIFETLVEHLNTNAIPVSEENFVEIEKRNEEHLFNLKTLEKL
ncbi:hypothetical protein DJ013_14375 [Arcticibacterium luteifluviistationis]|uniref:Uncharacterized protein n=1 Tax=Arcticibacterium luteifluviistationis TaxID=1784714 RepID=A0A2Z4GDG6_9BACT|nr:hypothetical protein DJ013_14375 [Arcticibacterium luteifluviistationis]